MVAPSRNRNGDACYNTLCYSLVLKWTDGTPNTFRSNTIPLNEVSQIPNLHIAVLYQICEDMVDISWDITSLIHFMKPISMSSAPTSVVVALQSGNLENHQDFLPALAVVNIERWRQQVPPKHWYALDSRLGSWCVHPEVSVFYYLSTLLAAPWHIQ